MFSNSTWYKCVRMTREPAVRQSRLNPRVVSAQKKDRPVWYLLMSEQVTGAMSEYKVSPYQFGMTPQTRLTRQQ